MPRALVLGNGRTLATFDDRLQLRDLYYPHVGMEDHTTYGNVHRLGFWVEGRGFSWLSDSDWQITIGYRLETLVGESVLRSERLGIEVRVEDSVHPVHDVLLRRFFIRSLTGSACTVRLFAHHDFHIYGDKQKDTALYEPHTNTVIHFRQSRYFLIGGLSQHPNVCHTGLRSDPTASVLHSFRRLSTCGISGFAVGKSNYQGLEGTWRDAEDGQLSGNAVVQGSVDSCVSLDAQVDASTETEIVLWLCLGKNLTDVVHLHEKVIEETPERLHRNAANYWKSWVNKQRFEGDSFTPPQLELYKRSLLTLRLHADEGGAIVAAADSDIMAFNRDTYTYVWPRDCAFVCLALDRAGYGEVTRRCFDFCARVQMPDGYLFHKYNPDGSLGSTWHPWFQGGEAQLPIQEDETALVIYALWKHFQRTHDFEMLQDLFERFVKKAASFLCEFREWGAGLPLESYDPWEEYRGVFTYTTCCTIAGLHAAAEIAQVLGHLQHSHEYQHTADEMRQALLFHLYDEGSKRFLKKIRRKGGKTIERDDTLDASLCVLWKLGVLPPDDPRVVSTMEQMERALSVHAGIGGVARYTNDFYHMVLPHTPDTPGNPWIITTLWLMQWKIARTRTLAELDALRPTLDWVVRLASRSGLLPEQVHPVTGQHLSVSPLAWSHATYIETILDVAEREQMLKQAAGR
jgi:GH15 family glucan-1,4-alpha-glucosidase